MRCTKPSFLFWLAPLPGPVKLAKGNGHKLATKVQSAYILLPKSWIVAHMIKLALPGQNPLANK